jgi:L-fuculose-phosphate aldolase
MSVHADLTRDMIAVGRRLYDTGIALARSGNISARMDDDSILITGTGTYLGKLTDADISCVRLPTQEVTNGPCPSSELPMHALIYRHFPCRVVVHCHPPLTNGYFAAHASLKALTFETKCYLGDVPVIDQDTPTVTEPERVIEALKGNNLIVLRNHGAVAVGNTFDEALSLVEALEEAVKTAALARLFKKDILDDVDAGLLDALRVTDEGFPMFSREHIQAIVDLVNQDEFIAQKGKELGLTVRLCVKLDDSKSAFTFVFEQGRIISLEEGQDAPFVISAGREVWQQVFLGKLDSFVAVTQGKMKLQGQLGTLSKWYVPFSRLFQLFRQVKFA